MKNKQKLSLRWVPIDKKARTRKLERLRRLAEKAEHAWEDARLEQLKSDAATALAHAKCAAAQALFNRYEIHA